MIARLCVAAAVGMGVMWLASSAGAASGDADPRPVPNPTVAATGVATDPVTGPLRGTVERVVTAPEPVVRHVEPVVDAVAELPRRATAAVEPVVAPVLEAVPAPALPITPPPITPPPVALPTVTTLPIELRTVTPLPVELSTVTPPTVTPPTVPVRDLPSLASSDTAGPNDSSDADERLELVVDTIDTELRRVPAAASTVDDADAPVLPLVPLLSHGTTTPIPAPSASAGGIDRLPTLGVTSVVPRAPRGHTETLRPDESHAVSQPSPRPPVAPD